MRYLDNAPPALIQLYERGPKIDDNRPPHLPDTPQSRLKKLLCDPMMKKAWDIIRKSVKREEDYKNLYEAIVEAMRIARRGIVLQTDKREKYEDIAKRAEKLAKLIAEPQHRPSSGTPLPYTGDLDLQAYELLPQDVASILGAKSYAVMNGSDRADWAYSLLRVWPTMVELLEQLAIRARQQVSEPMSSGERNRGNVRARLFMCHLYEHFLDVDRNFRGFEAINIITSLAYGVDLGRKTVRKVVVDYYKRRPLKRVPESVAK